jgi:hypothetical protein
MIEAFVVPALRKVREERGTHFQGNSKGGATRLHILPVEINKKVTTAVAATKKPPFREAFFWRRATQACGPGLPWLKGTVRSGRP